MIGQRFFILLIVSVVAVAGVLTYSLYPFPTSVDNIGGKYSATVTHWGDRTQLKYTDESGQHISSYFDENMKPGLNWINSSTPESATILCWWDYGHMIKAVGERNVIIRNPSHEILNSVADPSGIKEFDSNEKILDVADALTADNQSKTVQIMEKYAASYLMVNKDDLVKSTWFFKISGLNYTDYLSNQGFTDLGKNTMIAKFLNGTDTESFTLVYQDLQMKVYELK